MKKRFAVIVVAVLFLLNLQNVAWGQSVDGRIYQNGQPAPHVLVIFSRGDAEVARAITGNDGYYYIRSLPKGTYKVTLQFQGGTKTESVTVGGEGSKFDFSI